jgi:phosphomannomutase/phosphoglucomutase
VSPAAATGHPVDRTIFRAYDVRGVVDRDVTEALARDLGRAFGTSLVRGGARTACAGRDCRLHSERLFAALVDGLVSTGLEVLDVGVVASPLLYFAVHHHGAGGGVQLTGSHNPAEYNGFKMLSGTAAIHGEAITHLADLIEAGDFAVGVGRRVDAPITDAYVDEVVGRLAFGSRRLKVVIDGGNGTGGPPALAILGRLGVAVDPLFTDMDGRFPNHHPDPTVEENLAALRERVLATGADLGVAYDGDADRIGVIDDQGAVLWGDRLLILLARDVLAAVPGAPIVAEVKCSKTLYDDIAAHGGRPIMSAVGHSLIKARMKEEGAALAGEMSGHIFYSHRWYGFDDALYTTGRLLEILSRADASLSALLADVPTTCVTPEIRLDVPEARKVAIVAAALAHFRGHAEVTNVIAIDGARVEFAHGWGLIRASNTQPVLVLRAEADTPAHLAEIRGVLEAFVAAR